MSLVAKFTSTLTISEGIVSRVHLATQTNKKLHLPIVYELVHFLPDEYIISFF